jgi:hypothetical protein
MITSVFTFKNSASTTLGTRRSAPARTNRLGLRHNFEKLFYRTNPLSLGLYGRGEEQSMRKGIAYFLIVITAISLTLPLIPTAKSQTENVKIVSYSWYTDTAGFIDVVGEVQNIGSNTIATVMLSGVGTTSTGDTLTNTVRVWVQNLAPQQKAPFYLEFFPQSSGQTSQTSIMVQVVDVQLAVIQADETTNYQYPDLKITSHTQSIGNTADDKGVYWVSGTIQNTGSQTAKNVRILGTFYNSQGKVVAVGGYTTDVLSASLAPSATANFNFGAYDVNQTGVSADQKIEDYSLLIQAEEPVMQGTPPTISPYPTGHTSPSETTSPTSPTDTQTPDQGNGSTSNTTGSSPPTWVYAVAFVAVFAVIVGAVLAFRKRSAGKEPNADEEPKKPTKKPVAKTKKRTPKRMAETSLTPF